jgi:peptide chain release factor 1
MQKEFAHISSLITAYKQLQECEQSQTDLRQQKEVNTDPDMAVLFDEELQRVGQLIAQQTEELEAILFPGDERDNLSVFLEIRAGTGGQEAALFAADLARMYMMYAQRHNWRVSVVDESPTDLGGFKEVILNIQGKGVFGHLKFESGVHRVQRVPSTEASGRIHTSTATVAVLPESEEAESLDINPTDLRIDTYRAGGAGGQHVNKTESAIRITHIPTGVVVTCQDDRSQHKNKAKAMKILKLRLQTLEQEKRETEMSQARREQVGTGMRAEKVRTYNFPQNRVTDHQVNVTLNKLDMFMDGDMDDIIVPLRNHEREERRKNAAI